LPWGSFYFKSFVVVVFCLFLLCFSLSNSGWRKFLQTLPVQLILKDHLLNLQEEYLQDELDRESLQKLAPTRVAQAEAEKKKAKNNNNKGFEVKGAPWQGASDDAFPTLGGGGGGATATPVWGPRR
jgi:hypothetical protein